MLEHVASSCPAIRGEPLGEFRRVRVDARGVAVVEEVPNDFHTLAKRSADERLHAAEVVMSAALVTERPTNRFASDVQARTRKQRVITVDLQIVLRRFDLIDPLA